MIEISIPLIENGKKKSKKKLIKETVEFLIEQCDPFEQNLRLISYRKNKGVLTVEYELGQGVPFVFNQSSTISPRKEKL